MAKIEDVSVEDLQAALDRVDGKRETRRLMVAILYKRGPSVPVIAEWFDMRERTIYDWLDRLEERPIMDAITDDHRPGRPPKLTGADRDAFERAVTRSPAESCYDQPAWSTSLAQQFLREELGVEYSQRHVQRLLTEAGLRPREPGPPSPLSDEDERRQYWRPVATD